MLPLSAIPTAPFPPELIDDPRLLEATRAVLVVFPTPHPRTTVAVYSADRWRVFLREDYRIGVGIARWKWLAALRARLALA